MVKTKIYIKVSLLLFFKYAITAQNIKPFSSGKICLTRKSIQSNTKDTTYSSCFIHYFTDNNGKVNTYMRDNRIYDLKGSVVLLNKDVYVIDDTNKEYMKMKYNGITGDADKYFIDPNLFNQQFIEFSVPKIYDSILQNTPCIVYESIQNEDSIQISIDKKMYAPNTLTQKAYVNKSELQMIKYEMIFTSEFFGQYETLELKNSKSISNFEIKDLFDKKIDSLNKFYTLKSGEVSRFTKEPEKTNYSYLNQEVVNNLEFKLSDNSHFKFNTIKKKNILIVFWYSSCIPCVLKIPELNELSIKHKDNLEIIGVNFVEQDLPYIKEIIAKKKIKYKVAIDEGRLLKDKFKIYSVPSWFLFDEKGNLIETSENVGNDEIKNKIENIITIK